MTRAGLPANSSSGARQRVARLASALVAASLLAAFFLPLDPEGQALRLPELFAFAHVGVFALFGAALMRCLRVRAMRFEHAVAIILLAVLCLGGVIELVQPLAGRSAEWADVLADLAGGALGIAFSGAPEARGRAWRAAALCAVALVLSPELAALADRALARIAFPVLDDFETPFEAGRWSHGRLDREHARSGGASLRVDLLPAPYAGFERTRAFGDWSACETLELSLFNAGPDELPIAISIGDAAHYRMGGRWGDRFDRTFTLAPGWTDLSILVRDIAQAPEGRALDLARLRRFVIFVPDLETPRTVYLDRVRLR